MSEIDLLPRADIPVLFNDFKCKADAVWSVVDSLVITDVSQKEAMALARKTRLTLREIRIAVEHKRVELGEGHLKEIQKVNGAAKAIREFIEPLEARLLVQESYAERFEERRIVELTKCRNDEVRAIWPGCPGDFGKMSEIEYTALITRLRKEAEEMAEAKRKQIEAEVALAAEQAEAKRVAEVARKALELTQRVALEEKKRRDAEAEQVRFEQEAKLRNERSLAEGVRRLERVAAESRLRDEREKTAKLEAELAQERAAKQAEADAARRLAVAPDLEQLQAFSRRLQQIIRPELKTIEAEACLSEASRHFANAIFTIDKFISDRS